MQANNKKTNSVKEPDGSEGIFPERSYVNGQ